MDSKTAACTRPRPEVFEVKAKVKASDHKIQSQRIHNSRMKMCCSIACLQSSKQNYYTRSDSLLHSSKSRSYSTLFHNLLLRSYPTKIVSG